MKRRIAKIAGEENLQKAFEDLFHVMVNLRTFTKEWENVYGSVAKDNKKKWEVRADALINDLENGAYAPFTTPKRLADAIQEKNKIN